MNSYTHLTDHELHQSAVTTARREREETVRLLKILGEVDARKLYLRIAYSSLWAYVTEALGYDGAAAQRRIDAARMMRAVPEVESQLAESAITLSNLGRIEQLSRDSRRETGQGLTLAERKDWVEKLSGVSTREAEAMIREKHPLALVRETERVLTEDRSALTLVLDHETLAMLARLQEFWSGANPGISRGEVVAKALRLALAKEERTRKSGDANFAREKGRGQAPTPAQEVAPTQSPLPAPEVASAREGASSQMAAPAQSPPPAPEEAQRHSPPLPEAALQAIESALAKPSRYIPRHVARQVRDTAGNSCTYVSPATGKRCGSRKGLQIDHILPFAMGGSSTDPANLTLLCGAHNRARAEEAFGAVGELPFAKGGN